MSDISELYNNIKQTTLEAKRKLVTDQRKVGYPPDYSMVGTVLHDAGYVQALEYVLSEIEKILDK